jgi:hypothetical protein
MAGWRLKNADTIFVWRRKLYVRAITGQIMNETCPRSWRENRLKWSMLEILKNRNSPDSPQSVRKWFQNGTKLILTQSFVIHVPSGQDIEQPNDTGIIVKNKRKLFQ